eukprot:8660000-Alexandrium_andersonii.AAC.1
MQDALNPAHIAAHWRQDFREAGDVDPDADMSRIEHLRRKIWRQTEVAVNADAQSTTPYVAVPAPRTL